MPRLTTENIEEIELPSSTAEDKAIVHLNTHISTTDALKLGDAEDRSSAVIEMIADAIKSWNFVDADGNPEPITPDSVGRLHIGDFAVLAERFTEAVEAVIGSAKLSISEKKASS